MPTASQIRARARRNGRHEPESEPETDGHEPESEPSRSISSQGVRIEVGDLTDSVGRAKATFWPSNTALNQLNVGVVGDLGTGKTQLLQALVYNLRREAKLGQENPLTFLVFDYKRDFQKQAFLDAVGGKVLSPYRIPLNYFEIRGEFTKLKAYHRATSFFDVIQKIYGGVGPVQRANLQAAVTELYVAPDFSPPTLGMVLESYLRKSGKEDAISSILRDFTMAEIFSEDRSELVSFEELIDNRVLVVALDDLGADQNGKNALVTLFLNLYFEYMQSSTKWPYEGQNPQLRRLSSFLLVDEGNQHHGVRVRRP